MRLLEGDPRRQILVRFNVARSLEELGRLREARDEFQVYLERAPVDAPYRDETDERVRELDARIAAAEDGSSPQPPSSDGSGLVVAGVATLAAGAAIALVAIPTGVLTLDGRQALESACTDGACPPSEEGRLNDTRTLATVTDVLWASGLAIAAAGGVLLGLGLAQGSGAASRPVAVQGVCLPNAGCRMDIRGSF